MSAGFSWNRGNTDTGGHRPPLQFGPLLALLSVEVQVGPRKYRTYGAPRQKLASKPAQRCQNFEILTIYEQTIASVDTL
jgi:hypothetical protein